METIDVNLSCPDCGGEAFAQPVQPKADDKITCVACGAVRTWDDMQRIARENLVQARQNVIDAIRGKH